MNYPLLNAFWTMLWFFLWVLWLFLLFRVIVDIFRSHDLGGWGKTGWLVLTLVLPFLGVFIYLVARGQTMNERDQQEAERRDKEFKTYVQQAAQPHGNGDGKSTADQLAKLADLKSHGAITKDEYQQAKVKLLS